MIAEANAHMATRSPWPEAKTLADVAALTAAWLEGRLSAQPGYERGRGPDLETTPLVGPLSRANRAGFLTTCSQPGFSERLVADGRRWAQRPAVDGFIHPGALLDAIHTAATDSGLIVVECSAGGDDLDVVATIVDGEPHTWFGRRYNPYLDDDLCPHQAANDIDAACYVALVGQHYRDDGTLWDVLDSITSTWPVQASADD